MAKTLLHSLITALSADQTVRMTSSPVSTSAKVADIRALDLNNPAIGSKGHQESAKSWHFHFPF